MLQLVTTPDASQFYDHVTPAQQKNAAVVNSLYQLHEAVTKVAIGIVSCREVAVILLQIII